MEAGTRFGPFEIASPLGAGGMGEVYRARDTRLNREVALKVLPAHLALDPDRLARFTREAQVLASLNHPNIGAIYGLEAGPAEGGHDRQALVLELVEGPTLADRIAQGALPLDEALPIARQIADALEAAHEQGIIHRDLKPANVKLRPDGAVKVLDFGLAKALSTGAGTSTTAPSVDVTASPTMLSPATMTSAGIILGTAAYMSPEQARGKAVDRRADIWAFGCVLYEMITGRRAFEGEEITETLAGILRGDPDWSAFPPSTPRSIQRLLRRCLDKNPRERLQAIGDARLEIAEALAPHADERPVPVAAPPSRRRILPIAAAAAVALLTGAAAAWVLKPAAPDAEPHVTRSLLAINPFNQTPIPPGQVPPGITRTSRTAIAISPDGRTVVFRGNNAGQWQLYRQSLDSLDVVPVPGTVGADSPFFSPDGQWIAYVAAGELRRMPASGGAVASTSIARLPGTAGRSWGATWSDGDVIVFATPQGLWRVPAAGGTPERVIETQQNENARSLPHVLPGGKTVLFTLQRTVYRWDDAQIVARSLENGEEKVLLTDAADARYVSSGHLVFVRRGKLMAAPFDTERVALAGAPVALLDDVMQSVNMGSSGDDTGAGQFAVAADGTFVFVTGGIPADDARELVWVDRSGTPVPIPAPFREYVAPRVSPDGQRIVAFTSASGVDGGMRLWSYDLARSTSTPLTSPDERAMWPLWSPDGSRVVFESLVEGQAALASKPADGSGAPTSVTAPSPGPIPSSWSRDGTLAFAEVGTTTRGDIWILDTTASDRRPQPLLQTPANERFPIFSTDGKWLAYTSDESGRDDVYIQPFPGPGPRVLVSPAGGEAPAWRGDGRELFYLVDSPGGGLSFKAVTVTINAAGVSVGSPTTLFEGRFASSGPVRGYDVTADGKRFLMARAAPRRAAQPQARLVLVQNWFEELKRLAPPAP